MRGIYVNITDCYMIFGKSGVNLFDHKIDLAHSLL